MKFDEVYLGPYFPCQEITPFLSYGVFNNKCLKCKTNTMFITYIFQRPGVPVCSLECLQDLQNASLAV